MGKLHHDSTAAVAISRPSPLGQPAAGGGDRSVVTFGPLPVRLAGAAASATNGDWKVEKVVMSRSARVLMEGWVRIPGDSF